MATPMAATPPACGVQLALHRQLHVASSRCAPATCLLGRRVVDADVHTCTAGAKLSGLQGHELPSPACLQEFKVCLRSDTAAGLKLSRQDINTLLTEVDADGNGLVDYEVLP